MLLIYHGQNTYRQLAGIIYILKLTFIGTFLHILMSRTYFWNIAKNLRDTIYIAYIYIVLALFFYLAYTSTVKTYVLETKLGAHDMVLGFDLFLDDG